MDMRIKFEVSTKGMKNHSNARDVGFILNSPRGNSKSSKFEQGIEKYLTVKEDKISEFFRDCKYKMLIRSVRELRDA